MRRIAIKEMRFPYIHLLQKLYNEILKALEHFMAKEKKVDTVFLVRLRYICTHCKYLYILKYKQTDHVFCIVHKTGLFVAN